MGDTTKIAWAEHTWNPWVGCHQISPGCANCYAKVLVERWGKDFADVHASKTWRDPFRWQKAAEAAGKHDLVFTCSLSDFFLEEADQWRPEVWQIIKATPNLIYQILTKRPDNIPARLPADWGKGYPNCWLGTSVENKHWLKRMDILREVPARIRFVSAEPLIQDICPELGDHMKGFHWIIVGGESGNGSKDFRPMPTAWARNIRDLCAKRRVAFFFKQSAAVRTEMGTTLDGVTHYNYPDIPELRR
jgi:protein gp37